MTKFPKDAEIVSVGNHSQGWDVIIATLRDELDHRYQLLKASENGPRLGPVEVALELAIHMKGRNLRCPLMVNCQAATIVFLSPESELKSITIGCRPDIVTDPA